MKKIIFSLVALVAAMSMNAQILKVTKGTEVVATYVGTDYKFSFEESVKVASITLNKIATEIAAGKMDTLVATVVPANATLDSVSWSSSTPSVATISAEGVVTAIAEGTATITATATDGSGVTATCVVTVTAALFTGTSQATINGNQVNVNWVQLWENGPKFADRNAGMMNIADATSSNFIWGSNWCTPSKEDMSELFNAVSENETDRNNAKVTCEYVQEAGVYGFRFTGKEDNYTGNSLFFPTKEGSSDSGYGFGGYLTSEFIPDSFFGDRCIYLNMTWVQGNWYGSWERSPVNVNFDVRPVLVEE